MKESTCKHCKEKFDISNKPNGWMASHSRWCDQNPKRSSYRNGSIKAVEAMNAARKKSGITNQFTKAKALGLPVPEITEETREKLRIVNIGRKHTEETKKRMSKAALASNHRRLRKGVVEYKGILLDSSWELALAKRLDKLNIIWERPKPLPWIDEEGQKHNYFPDFYLPEKNLYLDPKNPHAIRVQKKKLELLLNQYNNVVILDSLEKCETYA